MFQGGACCKDFSHSHMNIMLLFLAFLIGGMLTIQAAVNSHLANGLDGNTTIASLVSFGLGTFALATFAIFQGNFTVTTLQLLSQPAWAFLGGFFGALAVFCIVLIAPKIGLVNLVALVIAGQLITSLLISHFGLFGGIARDTSYIKLAGVLTMMVGIVITLFGEQLAGYPSP